MNNLTKVELWFLIVCSTLVKNSVTKVIEVKEEKTSNTFL